MDDPRLSSPALNLQASYARRSGAIWRQVIEVFEVAAVDRRVKGHVKSLDEGSQLAQDQHPVDALGETLERINTLLSAMSTMFEQGRERFAVNETFVMHSLIAAQGLVVSAQGSLGQLHENCDLSLLADPLTEASSAADAGEEAESEEMEFPELEEDHAEPIPYAPLTSSARFVAQVTSSAANTDFSDILADRQTDAKRETIQDERQVLQDGFAQNYLELLRKLTAAEIFAAEQQALSPPGTQHQLLPLLRSLREDFQKIHSAA